MENEKPEKRVLFPGGVMKAPMPIIEYTNSPIVFDLEEMREICDLSVKDFEQYKYEWDSQTIETPTGTYIFVPQTGANILAVAHRDFVAEYTHFAYLDKKGQDYVSTPNLDDRLGCYIIIKLLKKLGIKADLLLTEGEEQGKSTAQYFLYPKYEDGTDKKYNWLVGFDRTGEDVVFYEYDIPSWRNAFVKHGFTIGRGSKSDIWYMDKLGICGANIGVGYYDYHGPNAFVRLIELKRQLERFISFYQEFQGTEFPFDRKERERKIKEEQERLWNHTVTQHRSLGPTEKSRNKHTNKTVKEKDYFQRIQRVKILEEESEETIEIDGKKFFLALDLELTEKTVHNPKKFEEIRDDAKTIKHYFWNEINATLTRVIDTDSADVPPDDTEEKEFCSGCGRYMLKSELVAPHGACQQCITTLLEMTSGA